MHLPQSIHARRLTGQIDFDVTRAPCGNASAEEILILRPNRAIQYHGQRDQGPVVNVAFLDALLGRRLVNRVSLSVPQTYDN